MQILNKVLESLGLQIDVVFNSIVILILIFTFSLIGAYLHEIYCVIKNKNDKIELNKILLTCITATFIIFYLSDTIITKGGYKGLVTISFASGAGGYKHVYRVYSGEFLDTLLNRFGLSRNKKKEDEDEDENDINT